MKERKTPKNRKIHPLIRITFGLIAIALLLFLSISAVKFCMSLFLTGDYIVRIPGMDSPVLYQSMNQQIVTNLNEATEPAPGSTTVTEVSRATVTIGGDIMMHMPIVRSGAVEGGYNFAYIFNYISNYVTAADYAVANLETTLSGTDKGNEYTGYPKFNSPDAIVEGAKSGGFDMLLTGNNHCNDYGTFGMKRTLDVIKAKGLDTLGTTSTANEARYVVKDVDGIRIGMINYTFATIGDDITRPTINSLATDSNAAGLVNAFDYKKLDLFYSQMESHIAGMKDEGAEVIVLYIHWGNDLTTTVSDQQKTIAQKMCDLGVDVIAGAHPHVVQEMVLLSNTTDPSRKTVCIYSMGNLLSNQRADNISLTTGHSEDGVLFTFNYAKYSDGSVHMVNCYAIPTWILIRGTGDARKYQILPLDKNLSDWKAVFELDAQQLSNAQDSYTRTQEIISQGSQEIQGYLASQAEAREKAWAAEAATE